MAVPNRLPVGLPAGILLALLLLPSASACSAIPDPPTYPVHVVVRADGEAMHDIDTGRRQAVSGCGAPIGVPPPFDGRFVGWHAADGWRVLDLQTGRTRAIPANGLHLAAIVAGNLVWVGTELRLEPAAGGNATTIPRPDLGTRWQVAGAMALSFRTAGSLAAPDPGNGTWLLDLATREMVLDGVPVPGMPAPSLIVASRDWVAATPRAAATPRTIHVLDVSTLALTRVETAARPLAVVGDRLVLAASVGSPGGATSERVQSVALPDGGDLRDDSDPRSVVGSRSAHYRLAQERPSTTTTTSPSTTASGSTAAPSTPAPSTSPTETRSAVAPDGGDGAEAARTGPPAGGSTTEQGTPTPAASPIPAAALLALLASVLAAAHLRRRLP